MKLRQGISTTQLVPRLQPENPMISRLQHAEHHSTKSGSGGRSLRLVRSKAGAWERAWKNDK